MRDEFFLALAVPGLGWLALTIAIAGLVRGFAGFGTAMIFMPVAVQYLSIREAITIMVMTGIVSSATLLPRAWRQADKGEVATLAIAATLMAPIGLATIALFDPLVLRWGVTLAIFATLAALVVGWQYRGRLGLRGRLFVGGASGMLGGLTGLTGPVVVAFYLSNARSVQSVRANVILFLAALDIALLTGLCVSGNVSARLIWIAGFLSLPYVLSTLIGQSLFHPKHEQLYRKLSYVVVALAATSGLPIFD
jgi:uncharacterized membrane protein YfcA